MKPSGEKGCHGAPRQGARPVVGEEGAIGITIERDAQVVLALTHESFEIGEVLRDQGVCRMIGECAVRLEVQTGEIGRNAIEDTLQRDTGHAVSPVHRHAQRADLGRVHDREQMLHVAGDRIDPLHASGGIGNVASPLFHHRTDLGQPRVGPDRGSSGAAQLDPVVHRRVVRCRDHRSGHVVGTRVVIHGVGRDLPEVDHVGACRRDAPSQTLEQPWRTRSDVAPHRNPVRVEQLDQRGADQLAQCCVEITGVGAAADVVGLEHAIGSHEASECMPTGTP